MNLKNLPKLGMRNIKTSVAVGVCFLLFELVGVGNVFYAALGAAVCMMTTTEGTVKAGITRTIGTIIGAVGGMIILVLWTEGAPAFLHIPLLMIGLSLSIYMCKVVGKPEATSICCIVFLGILTVHIEKDVYFYAWTRVVETVVGIGVAVIVNHYLKVPKPLLKYFNTDHNQAV